MTFAEFQRLALRPRAGQRRGQAVFNALAEERPDLSEQARGGPLDPFYRDDVLPAFWEWLEEHW